MTNGDYIRTHLPDKTLVEFQVLLCDIVYSTCGCISCPFDGGIFCMDDDNPERYAKWLKAERKEEVKSND